MAHIDASWLTKKMRGVRNFCILMIVLGIPAVFYTVKTELLAGDDALLYYFFYMMAWTAVNAFLQLVKKPGFVRAKRGQFIQEHPELSEDFKEAIQKGETRKGMDAEMCMASTGKFYRDMPNDEGVVKVTHIQKNVKGSMV